MATERGLPIYSTRADDPDAADAIDAFVIGLAERIDGLQDADADADLMSLARRAEDLAREAETLGFGPLASLAQVVVGAAGEDKPDEAHAYLVDLTRLAQRVRQGHRGSL